VHRLEERPALYGLKVQFVLFRPRTGEKLKTVAELVELTTRSTHEQELFAANDWNFIRWLAETYRENPPSKEWLLLKGIELLQWLSRWGPSGRFELAGASTHVRFHAQLAELTPHLQEQESELSFTHQLRLPTGETRSLDEVRFFAGEPPLVLLKENFFLLRNPPPSELLDRWIEKPFLPVRKLSHRLLTQLRKSNNGHNSAWAQLCVAHSAVPQFVFELTEDTVRLRLLARSELDQSIWQWNGHEWQRAPAAGAPLPHEKPEILDDARLAPASYWLRRLDWFTPEPGLWIGDANENFLNTLASAWPDRPPEAEYLGNPAFQLLFLAPRQIRPKLLVQGSGIDWFAVSAAWEAEGLKLPHADLRRLQSATGRYVKLPDSGWVELDCAAVQAAHETIAGLGLDLLSPVAQRVDLAQAVHLDEATLQRFGDQPQAKELRRRIAEFDGIPVNILPASVQAEMRPYQKDGFDFLCHLTHISLGGILADDMGLGKTLQTLAWLAWLREQNPKNPKPALVICPASVLHNWRREANRFTPHLKVLLMESGAARHNLRKQIPQHDIIITNYALLRRDLAAHQQLQVPHVEMHECSEWSDVARPVVCRYGYCLLVVLDRRVYRHATQFPFVLVSRLNEYRHNRCPSTNQGSAQGCQGRYYHSVHFSSLHLDSTWIVIRHAPGARRTRLVKARDALGGVAERGHRGLTDRSLGGIELVGCHP
jgi:hypothetical protein